MILSGFWRLVRATDYKECAFPEGVVVYDARNRLTLYLAHPIGVVFEALKNDPLGLDANSLLDSLLVSGVTEISESELGNALAELENLQLITACP